MRFKLGSLWRKGIPIVRTLVGWRPVINRWIKVNNQWRSVQTPTISFSSVINMLPLSNSYWDLFYAYLNGQGVGDYGSSTTSKTNDGVVVSSIALTVRLAGGTTSQHRTIEVALVGDHTARHFPVVYLDGIPAFKTHSFISGSVTVFFFTSNQDMLPKVDMELTF